MEKKSIEYLNEKFWYRGLKVIYFAIVVFVSYYLVSEGSEGVDEFLWTVVVLEVLRRAFYYIVLGSIFPKHDNKHISALLPYAIGLLFGLAFVFAMGGFWWVIDKFDTDVSQDKIDSTQQQDVNTIELEEARRALEDYRAEKRYRDSMNP